MRKNSLRLTFGLTFLFWPVLLLGQAAPATTASANDLWEKMIEAKGGRSNLHGIKSLLVSSNTNAAKTTREFRKISTIELFVSPNKWWFWYDERPGFKLGLDQFDFERGVLYELTEGSTHKTSRPADEKPSDGIFPRISDSPFERIYHSRYEQYVQKLEMYLIETADFQPKVETVTRRRVDGRDVDIVEATAGRMRMYFYLDPKTFLPFRLVLKTIVAEYPNNPVIENFEFGNYTRVAGVMFPQFVGRSHKDKNVVVYQADPRYDKNLWTRDPSIDDGSDGWRKKN